MSQPLRKVTLNAGPEKATQADRQGVKRRREPENTYNIDDSRIGDTIFASDTLATGPTSFAGLIPGSEGDGQGTRPHRKLKVFQDVLGTAATAAAAGAGLGTMPPLSQSNWLPPIMAPRPPKALAADGQSGEAVGASNAAATALAARLLGLEMKEPPMDWSLKTSLRFTSAQPFKLVDTARRAPRSEVIDAERSFTACIGDTDLSPHQRLLAASMTWQFPQNPQPPAPSRPLGTSVPSHIQQRRKDWQESLCSLYDSLRTGQCSAFYVVSPQLPSGIGKQPFTVLFTAAGVKGSERVQAVMGTSSAGVRSMLKMQGVEFEAPLMVPITNNINTGGGRSTSTSDHTTRSMLVFTGALRVHALFDFMLNRAFTLLDAVCDVPILLAPVQFMHAAIKKFTLTLNASTAAAAAAAGTSKGARKGGNTIGKTLHTLDVKVGMIPGWVADRLLRALTSPEKVESRQDATEKNASTATGTFQINMLSTPFPASVALNWHTSLLSTTTDTKKNSGSKKTALSLQCIGGSVSDTEAKRWSQTLEGLDTAAVREMKFTGGEEKEEGKEKGMYQIVQATTRILPLNF